MVLPNAHHFTIPYILTINTSPHGFWIIANILNNSCPYSLTVFFQVFLHFMCSKMKKIWIVLIVGKTLHKKRRETLWSSPLFSLIGLTNQEKLWLVSSEDTFTNSGGLEVDKFISLDLLSMLCSLAGWKDIHSYCRGQFLYLKSAALVQGDKSGPHKLKP